jgi:hypothetical protein
MQGSSPRVNNVAIILWNPSRFCLVQGTVGRMHRSDFLMTYDVAEGLIGMAKRHGFETRQVAMKNTHHAVMSELLIGRDLSWVP